MFHCCNIILKQWSFVLTWNCLSCLFFLPLSLSFGEKIQTLSLSLFDFCSSRHCLCCIHVFFVLFYIGSLSLRTSLQLSNSFGPFSWSIARSALKYVLHLLCSFIYFYLSFFSLSHFFYLFLYDHSLFEFSYAIRISVTF